MAQTTVDTLLVKIQADTKQLQSELKKLQSKTQQSTKQMSKGFMQLDKGLARTVKRVGLVGGAIATAFSAIAIKKVINVGSSIESLQIRLNNLFGSVEEGAKAFDAMAAFASKVPFSLEQIQQGSGALAAVAKDADELAELLFITGNAAAATQLGFADTSLQIQRTFTAGLGAADRFRDASINSFLGIAQGAELSLEETRELFEKSFGKGGRFGQLTDELANTLSGTLSMIGDKVFNFQRLIADERFFNTLKEQFGELNKFLDENRENIDQIAVSLGTGLADALESVVSGMIFLNENMEKVKLTLGLLTGLVAAAISPWLLIAGAIGIAGNELKKFVDVRKKANAVLNPFTEGGTNQTFGMGTGGEGFTAKVPKPKVVAKDPDKLTEALANMEKEIQLLGLKNDKEREFQKILDDTGLKEQIHINKLREKFDTLKELEKVQEKNNEIMGDAQSIIEGNKTEQEKLNEQILIFEEALNTVADEDVPKVQEALIILKEELRELDPLMQEITQIFDRASASISQAIADSITEGKNLMESLKDITRQVVNQMIAEFMRLKVIQPLMSSIFGGQSSGSSMFGGGGGGSSFLGGLFNIFGGMGSGNSMQQVQGFGKTASFMLGGAFSGRAGGGAVQGGQANVVGERGPEVFVPNTGGKIVPNYNLRSLGGQSTVVNQSINISTGVSQTVRAEMLNFLPAIRQETLQAVADSRLRGGTFGAAFTR